MTREDKVIRYLIVLSIIGVSLAALYYALTK